MKFSASNIANIFLDGINTVNVLNGSAKDNEFSLTLGIFYFTNYVHQPNTCQHCGFLSG
jgi:hypothetical protein